MKVFEAQHRSREPFDASVVLLDDVVQIFALADRDTCFIVSVHLFETGCIRTTLINIHQTGFSVLRNRFFQNTQGRLGISCGRQKKVDRLSLFIADSVQLVPSKSKM